MHPGTSACKAGALPLTAPPPKQSRELLSWDAPGRVLLLGERTAQLDRIEFLLKNAIAESDLKGKSGKKKLTRNVTALQATCSRSASQSDTLWFLKNVCSECTQAHHQHHHIRQPKISTPFLLSDGNDGPVVT